MKKRLLLQRVSASIFALSALLGLSTSTHAGVTINPIELVNDGGNTFNSGVSSTTKLFLDVGAPGEAKKFWVRVNDNPGIPPDSDSSGDAIGPQADPFEVDPIVPTQKVYVKYFPYSRYLEILRAVRGIQTFGTVNPYVDGSIICDLANTTIRIWYRSIFMAYNCGSSAPNADGSTFIAESLINRLRAETISSPDFEGDIPQ